MREQEMARLVLGIITKKSQLQAQKNAMAIFELEQKIAGLKAELAYWEGVLPD